MEICKLLFTKIPVNPQHPLTWHGTHSNFLPSWNSTLFIFSAVVPRSDVQFTAVAVLKPLETSLILQSIQGSVRKSIAVLSQGVLKAYRTPKATSPRLCISEDYCRQDGTTQPVEVHVAFLSHHPGWDEQLIMELPTSSLPHEGKHLFTSPQESRTQTIHPSMQAEWKQSTYRIKGNGFYFSFCCFVLKYTVCALSASMSMYHMCAWCPWRPEKSIRPPGTGDRRWRATRAAEQWTRSSVSNEPP